MLLLHGERALSILTIKRASCAAASKHEYVNSLLCIAPISSHRRALLQRQCRRTVCRSEIVQLFIITGNVTTRLQRAISSHLALLTVITSTLPDRQRNICCQQRVEIESRQHQANSRKQPNLIMLLGVFWCFLNHSSWYYIYTNLQHRCEDWTLLAGWPRMMLEKSTRTAVIGTHTFLPRNSGWTDFDEIWHGDVVPPSWPSRLLKICNFENPSSQQPPSWKIEKLQYLDRGSSAFDEIWHNGAVWASWLFRPLKIPNFENPRWRRRPC